MTTPDKYFGIGGTYRIDASGNRVPDGPWPDQCLADNPNINRIESAPVTETEITAPAAPTAPAKPASTDKE